MSEDSLVYQLVILAIALITILSVIVSYTRNNDLFSPVKIFIVFNIFFYADIYFSHYSDMVVATYFLQCFLLFIFSFIEKPIKSDFFYAKAKVNTKIIIAIWMLSMISILNQLIIIAEFGGILNYIGNMALRVEYFKGKGYILILNNLIATLNIIYLSLMLSSSNNSKAKWMLFVLHFSIFVAMALLSGSRSFLLMTIMVEIICYHYFYKRLTVAKMAPIVLSILFMVALLGGVRNSMDTSDGVISVKGDNVEMNSTHFQYGLIPLEIIFNSEMKELSYGMTYGAFFTNFVPRHIFPDKLDSGGVVFTKLYTGDRWGGLSNLATGAVTEGIVNFGPWIGFLVGFSSLALLFLVGVLMYYKLPIILASKYNYIYIILYIYFILAFARYSYSDFSYTYYSLVLNVFIPTTLVITFSKLKLIPVK